MTPLKQMTWAEESIQVELRSPSITQEPENQKIFEISHSGLGEVRFRLMLGCYGPGTEQKPTPRYYWTLGESVTIHCKDVPIANWFREELMKWLKSLDGVVLERVEE